MLSSGKRKRLAGISSAVSHPLNWSLTAPVQIANTGGKANHQVSTSGCARQIAIASANFIPNGRGKFGAQASAPYGNVKALLIAKAVLNPPVNISKTQNIDGNNNAPASSRNCAAPPVTPIHPPSTRRDSWANSMLRQENREPERDHK